MIPTAPPDDAPVIVQGHRYFTPAIGRILGRTPVALWNAYAILLPCEGHEATLMVRGELAAWLAQNDLLDLAHEARARRVPPGGLLVLSLNTTEGPFFKVLFDTRRTASRGRP